jgi:hypothetical protein
MLEHRLDVLAHRIDEMTHADEIADRVTTALHDQRAAWFNLPRRIVTGLIAVVVAIPAAHDLISWISG